MIRLVATLALSLIATSSAFAQGMSVGTSTSGGNLSPNGIRSDGALGSGGSFRPNNSTFGSPSSLSPTTAGTGTNPFIQAEDPQAMGRASRDGMTSNSNRTGQQATQRGSGRGGNFGNQFGFNMGQGLNNQNRSMNGSTRPIRSVTRIGFEHIRPTEEVVVQSVRSSLDPLPGIRGVNVFIENGVATIRGSAESDHHARLAAAMLSLEPGIHSVQNQLRVEGRR